jgi:glucose/arabinose dehydrogenase
MTKRALSRSIAACVALVAWCATFAALALVPPVSLREVATGLSYPVEAVPAPGEPGRLYIVEQGGRIRLLDNGTLQSTPFLNISSGVISLGGERGLLGLAFHPDYASNRAFYVFYTRTGDGALVVARILRSANNPNQADASTRTEILVVPHATYSNHNGGKIAFGRDGFLYIGTGDGGGGNDPLRAGQDLSSRLGKLLRISVDGGTGYTIPAGNPFSGQTCATACPEIWAYGLRNPWRFSFDRVDGDLFIGDVGQGAQEEVDYQRFGSAGGVNFGWGVFEGTRCNTDYPGTPATCTAMANHTPPVLTYGRTLGNSITGGFRYRGTASAALEGFYIYGDYGSRRVWAARLGAPGAFATEVLLEPSATQSGISSFAEDADGNLYLLELGSGSNGRLLAIDGPATALSDVSLPLLHTGLGSAGVALRRDLPLDGPIPVEPRASAGARTLRLGFSAAVSSATAVNIRDAGGAIVASPTVAFGTATVSVSLPAALVSTRFQVEIDGLDGHGGRIVIPAAILVGDVTASGKVTAADIAAIKARQGQTVTPQNARFDLDRSGSIDAADISIARGRAGTQLP